MCKYYFRFIYNKNIFYILFKKATNNYLLVCLFLCLIKSKIVLKIRSPPVFYFEFNSKIENFRRTKKWIIYFLMVKK